MLGTSTQTRNPQALVYCTPNFIIARSAAASWLVRKTPECASYIPQPTTHPNRSSVPVLQNSMLPRDRGVLSHQVNHPPLLPNQVKRLPMQRDWLPYNVIPLEYIEPPPLVGLARLWRLRVRHDDPGYTVSVCR